MTPEEQSNTPTVGRLTAIDAYRGLAMTLMMAEVLEFRHLPPTVLATRVGRFLADHQTHVEWVGCSIHDLIQPSFSMLVGVALPFSIAARIGRGQGRFQLMAHALVRATILVFLGIFLRSVGREQTNYTFEDTLTQIGLGYPFLFWLGFQSWKKQWIILISLLVGYWAAFVLYPLPSPNFDYASVGVPADWNYHLRRFSAHWDKNSNFAWAFDCKFLNLFPRPKPFTFNAGGYATLSFIPTLATMLIGLLAGQMLRNPYPIWAKIARLIAAGIIAFILGWLLDAAGICPIVKRIWTPSWVLYSGGLCLFVLAFFLTTTDAIGRIGWVFPFRVVGMNSIAAYVLAELGSEAIAGNIKIHLGQTVYHVLGSGFAPLVRGIAVLIVLWLTLFWMYRRKIFLRV